MNPNRLIFLLLMLVPLPLQAALQVFSCEPEWAALTKEIGADRVDVTSATQAMQDPHFIQARPSLIARVRKADLLICTGAGLESGWLPVLLRKGNNPRIQPGQPGYLMATDHVPMKEIPQVVDRSMGDVHASGNPHIQTDPRNLARVAAVLVERLKLLDAANGDDYQQRYDNFIGRWHAAIERWQQQAEPLNDQPVIVYHRSWIYLLDWLGMREIAALEPKPGIPPSSAQLARLLEVAEREQAKVLVYSQYQDTRAVEWFSSKSGVPAMLIPTTVNGTPAASDLFAWFDDVIARLLAASGN